MTKEHYVVQFRCLISLAKEFDEILGKKGYSNRSELFRKFMRDFIRENKEA